MTLRRLLVLHAIVTGSAGVVLIFAPPLIPRSVGIDLDSGANLLAYLLGASELSLAGLSYFSRNLSDRQALRVVCLTFAGFHLLTALVEIYAFTQGVSAKIWANVLVRLVVAGLFVHYVGKPANRQV